MDRMVMVVEDAPTSTRSCVRSEGREVSHDSAVVVAAAAPASSSN